jgi:hypothetical protein
MAWSRLSLARLVTFVVCLFFALVVMAMAAHTISFTEKWFGVYNDSSAFGVAMGVITLFVLGPLVVIDILRSGAFTSKIIVEAPVVLTLWVLWLACAALFADRNRLLPSDCQYHGGRQAVKEYETGCREVQALTAFSFLTWIALTGYAVALLVITILGGQKAGHKAAWHASVRELTSSDFASHNEKPTHLTTMQQQPTQQPQYQPQQPQQMHHQTAPTGGAATGNTQYSSYPQV